MFNQPHPHDHTPTEAEADARACTLPHSTGRSIASRSLPFLLMAVVLVTSLVAAAPATADVGVHASLCNRTQKPVEFHLFNHNDAFAGAAAFQTKAVNPCSCVNQETHTDLWHNFPIIRINQLVFRDVVGVSGSKIGVCVDAKGNFEGYVDLGAMTCDEARKRKDFLPAPKVTRPQGDAVILEKHLDPTSTGCISRDWTGGCTQYNAIYIYSDGNDCFGNE